MFELGIFNKTKEIKSNTEKLREELIQKTAELNVANAELDKITYLQTGTQEERRKKFAEKYFKPNIMINDKPAKKEDLISDYANRHIEELNKEIEDFDAVQNRAKSKLYPKIIISEN
ncbi:MAG: hypothetical protein NTW62_00960 [Candidatus Nomurabacteria bacterium]|nr:hypothetical protein [Candidatus Nomurabacteria bacterium]